MQNQPDSYTHQVIAHIQTDFSEKFGIPRQSSLIEQLHGRIVFEPPFRGADFLRGMEGFSHLWLVWAFSALPTAGRKATVRPPRLGGNTRMGVFATRSPFRPNPIGLSCVKFVAVQSDARLGPVLEVAGVDLLDGTPILDIKPYLPHADCHPEATGGFAAPVAANCLRVECPPPLLQQLPAQKQAALLAVLAQDPRPAYQDDPTRVYGFGFAGFEVRFRVEAQTLYVTDLLPRNP